MVGPNKYDAQNKSDDDRTDRKPRTQLLVVACKNGDRRGGSQRKKKYEPREEVHSSELHHRQILDMRCLALAVESDDQRQANSDLSRRDGNDEKNENLTIKVIV